MFENKVALVTGSGRGIGATIARHFASLGADVVVNYFRNPQPAIETAESIRQLEESVAGKSQYGRAGGYRSLV